MKRLSELSGTGGQAHREGLNQEREADKKLNKLPKPDQTMYMLRKKRNAINQHDKSFFSPQLGSHDIYSMFTHALLISWPANTIRSHLINST